MPNCLSKQTAFLVNSNRSLFRWRSESSALFSFSVIMGVGDSNPRIIRRSCSKRCQHCAAPLSKDMIGSAVGGTASAFYGFNNVMPIVRKYVKGPMWLHFLIGAPPVIVFSSACAGLAGGAVPALAQLTSSSYQAAVSSPSLPPPSSQDDPIGKSRTISTLS